MLLPVKNLIYAKNSTPAKYAGEYLNYLAEVLKNLDPKPIAGFIQTLQDARERAVKEDKPLFLWRSGGGDVLGRT